MNEENNNEQIASVFEVRKEKLAQIKALGDIPYKDRGRRDASIKEILNEFENWSGKEVFVSGRIMSIRKHGKAIFADIKDDSAQMQLHIRADNLAGNQFAYFDELVDIGDFLEAGGKPFVTKRGEKSIEVINFKLLSKSLSPLPDKWHGLQDIEKKQRYRYLDLIMDDNLRNRFRLRAKLVSSLRHFLDDRGFLEVETPTLQANAGGALAKPFKTYYNAFDTEVKLRISLEIPLKKLILAGYEKVYEIGRVYRNEGRDPSHLQEFTQLEFYNAYVNYEDLMELSEDMIKTVLEKTMGTLFLKIGEHNIDMTPPYPKKNIYEMIQEHSGHDLSNHKTADELRSFIKQAKIDIDADINKLDYGKLIDEIYKKIARPHVINPVFLIDHPIELSPLARVKDNDPTKVDRFQLIVNGWEMLNAYSELIDPIDQEERFKVQALNKEKGDEEAHDYDKEYVEAMRYGMPPIAGWGMGIDRFMALLTGIDNVRELIIFPFVKPKEEQMDNPLVVEKVNEYSGEVKLSNDLVDDYQGQEEEQNLTTEMFTDEELDKLNTETTGITREEAKEVMIYNIKNVNLQKHSLAVEAILQAMAQQLKADSDVWGIAGLLHDVDYEKTMNEPTKHCNLTADILKGKNVSPLIIQAVRAHNPACGSSVQTRLDQAILAADPMSGFIVAAALVQPDKKLASVNTESLMKKFKDKSFAKGADREAMKSVERLGLSLEEFVKISLAALQSIADDLGM
ncbi:MAG TPA: lysine--tRNA ligase [bacterium]|nr:lysine--tRNA ligase [bacterium]